MSRFHVIEQTIRRHGTRDRSAGAEIGHGNEPSRLRVKKYLPKTNSHARPGDVTILAVNADGFPDELYDSLWDDLLEQMQARKRRLRSIWIVDIANQAQGGDDEGIFGAEGRFTSIMWSEPATWVIVANKGQKTNKIMTAICCSWSISCGIKCPALLLLSAMVREQLICMS